MNKVEGEMHLVKKTTEEAENSAKTISEMFNDARTKTEREQHEFLKEEFSNLDEKTNQEIQTSEKGLIIYIKSRSMGDKFIFSGIL